MEIVKVLVKKCLDDPFTTYNFIMANCSGFGGMFVVLYFKNTQIDEMMKTHKITWIGCTVLGAFLGMMYTSYMIQKQIEPTNFVHDIGRIIIAGIGGGGGGLMYGWVSPIMSAFFLATTIALPFGIIPKLF